MQSIFDDLENPKIREVYAGSHPSFEIFHTLAKARRRKGYTQVTLAKKLKMPQSTIARIEAGRANPKLETLQTIIGELGLHLYLREKINQEMVRALRPQKNYPDLL